MALLYTYQREVKNLTFENTGLFDYTVKVYKQDCEVETLLKEEILKAGTTLSIKLTLDGVYRVTVADDIVTEEIFFKDFTSLITSFINSVEKLICGCAKCDECQECNDCNDYLSAMMKGYSYMTLTTPENNLTVLSVSNLIKCEFTDQVLCQLKAEMVYGKADFKYIIQKILSTYYLGFMYKEIAMNPENREEIYIKYKFAKISKCMSKIGIPITQINDALTESAKVYYWQIGNTTENISNVLPIITPEFLLSKNSQSLNVFEQGYNVNYTTAGRIVFVIQKVAGINFNIFDSLGNNVTEAFDVAYNVDQEFALFVSKSVYVPSQIFFKFKMS